MSLLQLRKPPNNQSFACFIEHRKLLYAIAFRLTNNSEDSEDLLQDLAFKIQQQPNLLLNSQNPKAYLVRTLNNLHIDQWRSQKNKAHYKAQTIDDCELHAVTDTEISIEQQVERQQLAKTIEQALSEIPNSLRIVVSLFDIEGYSLQEIAEIIDIPIGTVKSRLHRARNSLRNSLTMQPFNDTP